MSEFFKLGVSSVVTVILVIFMCITLILFFVYLGLIKLAEKYKKIKFGSIEMQSTSKRGKK
jgi:hypothetical protein